MLVKGIIQPSSTSTLAAIKTIVEGGSIVKIDVAVAYTTIGGVQDLINTIRPLVGDAWTGIEKRWLTSFDYLRTEPLAIEILSQLEQSSVRIHDGPNTIFRRGAPQKPFHPKTFLIKGKTFDAVLAGSGNLSRSGLSRGHETGLVLTVPHPMPAKYKETGKVVASFHSWFDSLWLDGVCLNNSLLVEYRKIYESAENLAHIAPTDDDISADVSTNSSIQMDDLRKLRACRNFWIEAGNITKNRGQSLPGNQLMMKRLSRVYFGVPPAFVPHNSPLTELRIFFEANEPKQCFLTFSDNGMDKLTLPIPGAGGPPYYDGRTLLFYRTGASEFRLSLGSTATKAAWKKSSKALGALYKMPSGRNWGVF